MALGFTATTRSNMMDEITALIDAGTAASLKIYEAPQATNADTAVGAQTLLADLTMQTTSFGAASSGVITANLPIGDATADDTGTAAWFRIEDSAGNAVVDGTVGVGGSFDLNLNTVAITSGVTVDVTSMVLTAGNA